jgi:4a-hydroxytetrahydrobiopterin dehydratase
MDWKENNGKLSKTFIFKTQTELAHFLLKVAIKADEFNHHPDYMVSKCSQVDFMIFSHDTNKISTFDIQLATKIDAIYNLNL